MGNWTPRIIQGGKSDSVPEEVCDFLKAFNGACISEFEFAGISFESLPQQLRDMQSAPPPQPGQLPQMAIAYDRYGSPIMVFSGDHLHL